MKGIDGLVRADLFFGEDDAVRASLEEHMSKDEGRAACRPGAPRQSLYLFGQIGDRQVSLHGERGRVVVRTEDGELCGLAMDRMVDWPGHRAPRAPGERTEELLSAPVSAHGGT